MNLCIDIGNTRTKTALFKNGALVRKEVLEALTPAILKTMAYNQKVEKVILSSVAVVPAGVEEFLKNNFYYLQLGRETPLPIVIRYKTPDTLGKDRIAAAAGASRLFPGENCLVIDAGTCITSDLLSAGGEFLGGNISPGVEMRLKAMHHFTARLPLVEPTANRQLSMANYLGDSTESAIRNGGMLGAVWEMQGFIRQCRKHFRPLRIVLTGGDMDFFAKNLKTKIFAHPDLVLAGLNEILNYNVEKQEGF